MLQTVPLVPPVSCRLARAASRCRARRSGGRLACGCWVRIDAIRWAAINGRNGASLVRQPRSDQRCSVLEEGGSGVFDHEQTSDDHPSHAGVRRVLVNEWKLPGTGTAYGSSVKTEKTVIEGRAAIATERRESAGRSLIGRAARETPSAQSGVQHRRSTTAPGQPARGSRHPRPLRRFRGV